MSVTLLVCNLTQRGILRSAKIEHRREVYRKIAGGQDELWEEYFKLRREAKNLVTEKKLNIWNEVLEKANSDYDGNRKEFWAFVGRRMKGRKRAISALRNEDGVSMHAYCCKWLT